MTIAADELISYNFKHLQAIYQLNEQKIASIIQKNMKNHQNNLGSLAYLATMRLTN